MNSLLEGRLKVYTGDITKETPDAIVNAANSSLPGAAGPDRHGGRDGGLFDNCDFPRGKPQPGRDPPGLLLRSRSFHLHGHGGQRVTAQKSLRSPGR